MKYKWVEKIITKTDWKNHHSHISSYTFLEEVDGGVKVGFLDSENSTELQIINNEYLRIIDNHRRATNTRPFCLESEKEKIEREEREEKDVDQEKIKRYLANEKEKLEPIKLEDIPF